MVQALACVGIHIFLGYPPSRVWVSCPRGLLLRTVEHGSPRRVSRELVLPSQECHDMLGSGHSKTGLQAQCHWYVIYPYAAGPLLNENHFWQAFWTISCWQSPQATSA